jgi:hypothetical protein
METIIKNGISYSYSKHPENGFILFIVKGVETGNIITQKRIDQKTLHQFIINLYQ